VAPYENDVWSHKQLLKVVSHTPIECEKLLAAQTQGEWIDVARDRIPQSEKVYTWWSYRAADLDTGGSGPKARSHLDLGARSRTGSSDFRITRDARGWVRPSDHVHRDGRRWRLVVVCRPCEPTGPARGNGAGSNAQLGARHQEYRWRSGLVRTGNFSRSRPRGQRGVAFQHTLKQYCAEIRIHR